MDTNGVRDWNPLAHWLVQAENVGVALKKMIVADVPNGTVCRFQGEWGVKEGTWLHPWDADPLPLQRTDVLEVLPPPRSLGLLRGRRPKGPPPDPR